MRKFIFHQMFEAQSSTYTYLIADPQSREAALIDPVIETLDRDLKLIDELGLNLKYVLDTHIHADHVTAAGELRKRAGAKTAVSAAAKVDCVDLPLADNQELNLGGLKIRALSTPGHTDSCMSFHFVDRVFTGDALLIRGNGRTDFQQGSSEKLWESIQRRLFELPPDTLVFPAHDYRGHTVSSIGMEKNFNPRLGKGKTKEEFIKTMAELKLPDPKKIHEALPANMACGKTPDNRVLRPQTVDGVPEVTVEDVYENRDRVRLIDVRRPEEFNNELGHIAGAKLVTLGPDLARFLEEGNRDDEIVFVCRSGARSGNATLAAQQMGYSKTVNMTGGMIRWNDAKLPVERE